MTVKIFPPPNQPAESTRIAAELLAAADDPTDVVVDTTGGVVAFVVPAEVAAKAKINPEQEAQSGSADAAPEAKKKPSKGRTA